MGELDPYSSSLRIAWPPRLVPTFKYFFLHQRDRLCKRFPLLNIFSSPPLKERLCRNWPQNRPKQDWLEMFWNRESWERHPRIFLSLHILNYFTQFFLKVGLFSNNSIKWTFSENPVVLARTTILLFHWFPTRTINWHWLKILWKCNHFQTLSLENLS